MAQFNLKLRDEEDAPIIEYLRAQVNFTQYLRDLIHAEMANRSYTDGVIRRIREEVLHSGELEMENAELRREIERWRNVSKR